MKDGLVCNLGLYLEGVQCSQSSKTFFLLLHFVKSVTHAMPGHLFHLHSYICGFLNNSPSFCFTQNPKMLELEEALEIIWGSNALMLQMRKQDALLKVTSPPWLSSGPDPKCLFCFQAPSTTACKHCQGLLELHVWGSLIRTTHVPSQHKTHGQLETE